MPPAVVENLLWLYTEPGDIVVDPFAGGGTTIDGAKAMGRRVWGERRVLADDRPGNVTVGVDCQQAENSQRPNTDGHRPPRVGRGADRRGEVGAKRAIQDAGLTRSQRAVHKQQQTADQRRHVNGAAAADDMPTCGAGTVRSSDIHRPYSTGEAPRLRPYLYRSRRAGRFAL
jgi:hypothetical protein